MVKEIYPATRIAPIVLVSNQKVFHNVIFFLRKETWSSITKPYWPTDFPPTQSHRRSQQRLFSCPLCGCHMRFIVPEDSTFAEPSTTLATLIFASFFLFVRSLKPSLKKSECGRMIIVCLTISSTQSTRRSRLPPSISREPTSASAWVNYSKTFGTDDWFGIASIRIHRPSICRLFTVLNDCEPPDTIARPSVRPWVGRTDPVEREIQSI